MDNSPKFNESGAGGVSAPRSILLGEQHRPVVVLDQLLRRELATFLDRFPKLVDAPGAAAVVGLERLEVVDPVFLLDESVKIGDDEGDFLG